jgi:hypothetical protein
MLELVLTVCLAASPMKCHDIAMTFETTPVTPAQCAFFGQFHAAEWLALHPQYKLSALKCRPTASTEEI